MTADDDATTPEVDPHGVPVRCPAPLPEGLGADHPLAPLLARLADPLPVDDAVAFPRGTLQPDGRLDLCKQSLGPLGAAQLIPAAVTSPHTTHLLLGTNSLGATGVAALAQALPADHGVRTLYLGCNHIDADGVTPLADRLARDTTVRALWLKRNPIGDAGVRVVADALRRNPVLRTLDLTNTGLTVAGLTDLVAALRERPEPVERLYLGGNGLGPDAAPLLADLLRQGVRELYLACGRLGDEGARVLAEALPVPGAPSGGEVVLGLGGNGITPVGVAALATRLGALASLDLARPPSAGALGAELNLVGDEGATVLADALPGSGLRRLDLRRTGVTGRGARRLHEAVAGDPHSRLTLLGLGTGVPRKIKREVVELLRPEVEPAEDIRAIASVYR